METLVLPPTDSPLDRVSVPMVHQHRNPPLQSHARILDLTRNRHIVLCGRNCKASSPPKDPRLCLLRMASLWVLAFHPTAMLEPPPMEAHLDQTSVLMGRLRPHRHYPQTSRKSGVSMQITQLCHPPSVTYGARCKSTAICNAKTQASVPTWGSPTMASFATCGTEYRTAPALDPLDLVLPFHTQIAHTAASRTLCLPASSGVSLQLSQLEKCAQEDQCAPMTATQIRTTPNSVPSGARMNTSRG